MPASHEPSVLFTASTRSPLKELDISTYYPYSDSPLEELDEFTDYPYSDSRLEELDEFTDYPYLDSISYSYIIPSVGGRGLEPDRLEMPELVEDANEDEGRVVLYEEPDQPPREYYFRVKDNHFSLLSNRRFLAKSRFLEEEFEVFDAWLGKFVGLPSLSKWKLSATNPFLVVKIAGLPREHCPGVEMLLLELDDAIEAYLNDYEPIDAYLEG
ncbi:hypothetical protein NP233_g12456 [Leucocoprinus birnbaumii]|uniref:Uncharacterized protein n=1 Tax=Leucocoprinus birnbaumii TaxID=56174 RepID=A0AAD5VIJ2_9AGAR|nr:hypothetical protein NP233_g12456 [Leucocoprinus birnbaumii]